MQFVFIVHSVAEKLNYSKCKRNVSQAVGIPFSGDSGHQGTESPLQEIWWGFRPVGIPSSGDSRYIPIYISNEMYVNFLYVLVLIDSYYCIGLEYIMFV